MRNQFIYWQVDLTPRLKEIQKPTLIMHGTADPIVSFKGSEAMQRDIPGSVLEPLVNEVHGLAKLPKVHEKVSEWLDGKLPGGSLSVPSKL